MGLFDFLMGIVYLGVLGIAMAVGAGNDPWEFTAARGLFALAAIVLAVAYLVWLSKARRKELWPLWPLWPQIFAGIVTLLLVVGGTSAGWQWVNLREASANKPSPPTAEQIAWAANGGANHFWVVPTKMINQDGEVLFMVRASGLIPNIRLHAGKAEAEDTLGRLGYGYRVWNQARLLAGAHNFSTMEPGSYIIDNDTPNEDGRTKQHLTITLDSAAGTLTWKSRVTRKLDGALICETPPSDGAKPC